MSDGLKCPNCRGSKSYRTHGFDESLGRRYTQKRCPACGYEGAKRYYGNRLTAEEYREELARTDAAIEARLTTGQRLDAPVSHDVDEFTGSQNIII